MTVKCVRHHEIELSLPYYRSQLMEHLIELLLIVRAISGTLFRKPLRHCVFRIFDSMARAICSATVIAKLLVNEILCRHRAPKTLLSDGGKNFVSKLICEVCSLLDIKNSIQPRIIHKRMGLLNVLIALFHNNCQYMYRQIKRTGTSVYHQYYSHTRLSRKRQLRIPHFISYTGANHAYLQK